MTHTYEMTPDKIAHPYSAVLNRLADAADRIADRLTAQGEAPDMSEALEQAYQRGYSAGQVYGYDTGYRKRHELAVQQCQEEYQHGRADGAREQREADKRNLADAYLADAARALGTHLLITDTTDGGAA